MSFKCCLFTVTDSKGFGEGMGKYVSVRNLVGVNSEPIRAIKVVAYTPPPTLTPLLPLSLPFTHTHTHLTLTSPPLPLRSFCPSPVSPWARSPSYVAVLIGPPVCSPASSACPSHRHHTILNTIHI